MLQQHTTNLPYSWDVGGGLEWLIVWKFQQNKKVSVYGFLKIVLHVTAVARYLPCIRTLRFPKVQRSAETTLWKIEKDTWWCYVISTHDISPKDITPI